MSSSSSLSLAITRAVALSVKDPVWKYQWVKKHESDHFSRVHKWLDAKEYLIAASPERSS